MTDLWQSANYKTSIKYFMNTYIREYDLSKANISALKYMNRITDEQYNEFLNMPKNLREIKVGLMEKDDYSVYESIRDGITEARRMLCESNNIEDFEVVSVKNDAMFIAGRSLNNTEFPPFTFKEKNTYTMYMQLQELEIYFADAYKSDGSYDANIDVKGISDDLLPLHEDGMLGIIATICYKIPRDSIENVVKYLSDIYERYVKRSLPISCYRNFDTGSSYIVRSSIAAYSLSEADDNMVYSLDISRNLSILRDLMSIVFDIYRSKIMR